MKKSCANCKHRDVFEYCEPCDSCNDGLGEPDKWELCTNGDRIRAKTDGQLAEWIVQITSGNGYNGYDDERDDEVKAWLDWLKQPVEGEVDNA